VTRTRTPTATTNPDKPPTMFILTITVPSKNNEARSQPPTGNHWLVIAYTWQKMSGKIIVYNNKNGTFPKNECLNATLLLYRSLMEASSHHKFTFTITAL
jgi:hypothetical protein